VDVQYIKCVASFPGLFESTAIDLTDRITVIYGRNGSGKTLLSMAFIDGIWRSFSGKKFVSDESWNKIYIELIFSLSGSGFYKAINNSDKFYTINYKNGNYDKVIFSENRGENSAEDGQSGITSRLSEARELNDFVMRIDSDSFFDSSYVPSPSNMDRTVLLHRQPIQKLLIDDDSGFHDLHNSLSRIFRNSGCDGRIRSEIEKNEESLRSLNRNIEITDIKDSRADKLNNERKNIRKELNSLNGSLERFKEQKGVLKKIIEDLEKIEFLNNDLEKIKSEVSNEQEKLSSLNLLKEDIFRIFPQFNNMRIEDSPNLEKVQELFTNIRNINEKIDDIHFQKDIKRKRARKTAIFIGISTFISVASILYKNSFSLKMDVFLLGGILVFAFVSCILALIYSVIPSRRKDIQKLREERRSVEEGLKEVLEKSKVEIEGYKLSELYDFLLQYFEDYIEYTERTRDIVDLKKSLKKSDYLVAIEEKLDSLREEEESIRMEISENLRAVEIIKDIELETDKINGILGTIDREIELLEQQISIKQNILSQIDDELERNPQKRTSSGSPLMRERDEIEGRLNRLTANRSSLHFIFEVLNEAVNARSENRMNSLVSSALRRFNYLTNNQYVTRVDEALYNRMLAEGRLDGDFNQGTVYELLLCMKLSITDYLPERNQLPLIIDDPFQFMDDERTTRFKSIIDEVSRKRQVIIFTHQGDKKGWGNYIEL
jgi:uncharacterized protein YhaN